MSTFQTILAFWVAVTLTACASTKSSYQPSMKNTVQTETVVDMGFDRLWDRTVAELSQSFFVINNISRDSRIINVSFSSDEPEKFIDCGVSTYTAKHPARGEQTWTYPTAGSVTHWMGIDGTNHIVNRTRRTNLDGRINIFMAPQGSRTLTRVNAAYTLRVDVELTGVTAPGSQHQSDIVNLTSQSGGAGNGYDCRSTGVLEKKIIEIVQNAATE